MGSMDKIKKEDEEFVITYCKRKKLNAYISEFRTINPRYEVFSFMSTGGELSVWIVWKKIQKKLNK